jgi:hypothetical protein
MTLDARPNKPKVLIGAALVDLVSRPVLHQLQPAIESRKLVTVDRHEEPQRQQRRPNAQVGDRQVFTADEFSALVECHLNHVVGIAHGVRQVLRHNLQLLMVNWHDDVGEQLEQHGRLEEQHLVDFGACDEFLRVQRVIGRKLLDDVDANGVRIPDVEVAVDEGWNFSERVDLAVGRCLLFECKEIDEPENGMWVVGNGDDLLIK